MNEPRPIVAAPTRQLAQRRPPGWSKPLLVVMGIASPGGLIFLLAVLTGGHVNLPTPAWLLLAAAGGVGGYFLHRRLVG